mmetsp:Transcript_131803/g.367405  ORF Transcript_131803/g.367405 Transcript_131803/m.367405 type:complete len:235 (+) Transcript_131803:344-1048(+)
MRCRLLVGFEDLVEDDDPENRADAQDLHPAYGVPEPQKREDHRDHLARCHDPREHDAPELLDRVVDQDLPDGARDSHQNELGQSVAMSRHRGQPSTGPGACQHHERLKEHRKEAPTEHHLEVVHIGKSLRQLRLVLRAEGVKEEEGDGQQKAHLEPEGEERASLAAFAALPRTVLQLHRANREDEAQRPGPLLEGEAGAAEQAVHQHGGKDRETLGHCLHRERHVLQHLKASPS